MLLLDEMVMKKHGILSLTALWFHQMLRFHECNITYHTSLTSHGGEFQLFQKHLSLLPHPIYMQIQMVKQKSKFEKTEENIYTKKIV